MMHYGLPSSAFVGPVDCDRNERQGGPRFPAVCMMQGRERLRRLQEGGEYVPVQLRQPYAGMSVSHTFSNYSRISGFRDAHAEDAAAQYIHPYCAG